MARSWLLWGLLGSALLACAEFTGTPAPSTATEDSTSIVVAHSTKPDASAPGDAGDASTDSGSSAMLDWKGTRDATNASPYSGNSCQYSAQFSNIVLDIEQAGSGEVVDATLTAQLTTELTSTICLGAGPTGSEQQTYHLASATRLADGSVALTLAPDARNTAQASLAITGDLSAHAAELTLEWTHDDTSPAPLPWVVRTLVTVSLAP